MTWLDRLLQRWRMAKARPWVPAGARVLDVGCHQGEFLLSLGRGLGPSVGYDPLAPAAEIGPVRLIPERFPERTPFPDGSFDVAVLLATLEHLTEPGPAVEEIHRLLRPGGRVLLTVPASSVDAILGVLRRVGLIDGMSLNEHHGFDPATTMRLFGGPRFELVRHARFQLRLNNLYVFQRH